MKSLSFEEAEKNFADTLKQVAEGAEHIAIKNADKNAVYLVSAEDYMLFQKLLQEAEDRIDLETADARMNDPQQKIVSFDDFFKDIEL